MIFFSSRLTKKEKRRNYRLKKLYSIDLGTYLDLLMEQDFKCGICGSHADDLDHNLYVDHDHESGEIRGLLCRTCNLGLGLFKDSANLLLNAIKYLNKK